MSHRVQVEVWSDVVCPWCRIGRAHLTEAIARYGEPVDVVYRSFELDPGAPRERTESVAEHLAAKLRATPDQVEGMFDAVAERGADAGLDFRFDLQRSGNTFDAHRLLHLARDLGRQDEVTGHFMDAYFTEGAAIGDPETLARLATGAGLPEDEVADVLAGDRYADRVRADEDEAAALGVGGVPFFVFDRRLAASGAQPTEVLLGALREAAASAT